MPHVQPQALSQDLGSQDDNPGLSFLGGSLEVHEERQQKPRGTDISPAIFKVKCIDFFVQMYTWAGVYGGK